MESTKKPTEQDVLDTVTVRLIHAHEKDRWNRLIKQEHYLHNPTLVGEQLRYIAEVDGNWLALLSWSGAAYHIAGRDLWIGWSDLQRRNRLHFIVSNSRFLLRTKRGEVPNLASRILRLNQARLDADWRDVYGHGVLLAETFVDIEAYTGTCYKASNWIELGKTKGFERSGVDYYEAHERPKRLFIHPLRSTASAILSADELAGEWKEQERDFHPGCTVKTPKLRSLFEHFNALTDPRSVRGRRYPLGCLLTIAACAVLAGAQGYEAIADFAAHLTQPQRRALRCRKRRNGTYEAPCATTFWELLNKIDNDELDRVVCEVLRELQPLRPEAIAVDGKTGKYPEFKGNVAVVKTGLYWDKEADALTAEWKPPGKKAPREEEDQPLVLRADANPVIPKIDANLLARAPETHFDFSAIRGIFYGVF